MNFDLHTLLHVVEHTLTDTVTLLPFLYLCYLFLEFLERRVVSTEGVIHRLRETKWGPLLGGLFGMLPQCGFSAAAAGLYAGRIVSLGTLIAVFLSTSDEMLPLFIASEMPPVFILLTVLLKAVVAIACGFLVDLLFRRTRFAHAHTHTHDHAHGDGDADEEEIHDEVEEICRRDGCGCENHNIFYAAAYHTVRVFLFILLVTFLLTLLIELVGEDALSGLILNLPVVGNLLSALVGLIPNCAASVVLTELYLHGALSFGALFSGLLAGAGVGLLILFRVNRPMKDNFFFLALLWGLGAVIGILFDLVGIEGLLLAIAGGA